MRSWSELIYRSGLPEFLLNIYRSKKLERPSSLWLRMMAFRFSIGC